MATLSLKRVGFFAAIVCGRRSVSVPPPPLFFFYFFFCCVGFLDFLNLGKILPSNQQHRWSDRLKLDLRLGKECMSDIDFIFLPTQNAFAFPEKRVLLVLPGRFCRVCQAKPSLTAQDCLTDTFFFFSKAAH